jgi:hypothetical protein
LLDRRHLRVRRRGILCHRLVRHAEPNQQCEALDYDCANLVFAHSLLLRIGLFTREPPKRAVRLSQPLTCRFFVV